MQRNDAQMCEKCVIHVVELTHTLGIHLFIVVEVFWPHDEDVEMLQCYAEVWRKYDRFSKKFNGCRRSYRCWR